MSEMMIVEKFARAIFHGAGYPYSWDTLNEESRDSYLCQARAAIVAMQTKCPSTGAEQGIYQETHSGWTAKQEMSGEWSIVDGSGWTIATIHYDYRFTCNATNYHRAELLAKAPETATLLAGKDAEIAALRARIEGLEIVARGVDAMGAEITTLRKMLDETQRWLMNLTTRPLRSRIARAALEMSGGANP